MKKAQREGFERQVFLRTQGDKFDVTLEVPEVLYCGLEERTCTERKGRLEEERFMFFYFCSVSLRFLSKSSILCSKKT